jgi:hypothetical protein
MELVAAGGDRFVALTVQRIGGHADDRNVAGLGILLEAAYTSQQSALIAANATFALNAGVWFRRARLLIVSPDSSGTACPLSGRNSTYPPVQISGAGSNYACENSRLHLPKVEDGRARARRRTGNPSLDWIVAANYSTNSSAATNRLIGTASPSDFAVLVLIISSYLVGKCTGRFAGLSPWSIRLAYRPIWRYAPVMLGP